LTTIGNSTRPNSRGASATLTLLDVPLLVWRGAVRCTDAFRIHDGARTSLGRLKAGIHVWHERLAALAGLRRIAANADPQLLHRRKDGDYRRPSYNGHYCTSAASYDAVLSRFRDESGIASDPSRAGNDRNANAGGTGLHAWLDDHRLA